VVYKKQLPAAQTNENKKLFITSQGLTIVEVIVAIALLAVVVLISAGFVVPLQVTRSSSIETQALAYGRSYLELVREQWLESAKYESSPADATPNPVWPRLTGGTVDLKIPIDWSITPSVQIISSPTSANVAFNAIGLTAYRDTLRKVTVTVTPSNDGKPISLTTIIARPSP
jgi:prepilin-type N-terminal cleavage/methylation domain-containing protein